MEGCELDDSPRKKKRKLESEHDFIVQLKRRMLDALMGCFIEPEAVVLPVVLIQLVADYFYDHRNPIYYPIDSPAWFLLEVDGMEDDALEYALSDNVANTLCCEPGKRLAIEDVRNQWVTHERSAVQFVTNTDIKAVEFVGHEFHFDGAATDLDTDCNTPPVQSSGDLSFVGEINEYMRKFYKSNTLCIREDYEQDIAYTWQEMKSSGIQEDHMLLYLFAVHLVRLLPTEIEQ